MNYCPDSPTGRHAIEDVYVATGDEYSVVLEFTCVFCDKRGSIAHLLSDDVEWDEDEDDE